MAVSSPETRKSTDFLRKKLCQSTFACWKIKDDYYNRKVDALVTPRSGSNLQGQLWIEFKYIPKLPTREATIVKPALSEGQRDFINDVLDAGGQAIVILFVADKAATLVGKSEITEGVTKVLLEKRLMKSTELAKEIPKFFNK